MHKGTVTRQTEPQLYSGSSVHCQGKVVGNIEVHSKSWRESLKYSDRGIRDDGIITPDRVTIFVWLGF